MSKFLIWVPILGFWIGWLHLMNHGYLPLGGRLSHFINGMWVGGTWLYFFFYI